MGELLCPCISSTDSLPVDGVVCILDNRGLNSQIVLSGDGKGKDDKSVDK